jgi:hypothetical protein
MCTRFLMGSVVNLGQALDRDILVRIKPMEKGGRGRDTEGQDNAPDDDDVRPKIGSGGLLSHGNRTRGGSLCSRPAAEPGIATGYRNHLLTVRQFHSFLMHAMPGVEQARVPPMLRRQTWHMSVNSTQLVCNRRNSSKLKVVLASPGCGASPLEVAANVAIVAARAAIAAPRR